MKINKLIHKCFIMLAILLLTTNLLGQGIQHQTVIPPTPEAATLGKYGDIPVSHFTGTANVTIPIWEINEKGLKLPINLSYHASGIKVAEVAPRFGLGWALNAGGMITRTIQHATDEGHTYGTSFPRNPSDFIKGYYKDRHLLEDYNSLTNDELWDSYVSSAVGNWDCEPDIFHFNFNGYSGRFLFNENREAIFFPQSDIKVEVDFDDDDGFREFLLITPDGTKYYFGTGDMTSSTCSYISDGYMNRYFKNNWYLVKIESIDGDEINFEYEEESYTYYSLAPEQYFDPGLQVMGLCDDVMVSSTSIATIISYYFNGAQGWSHPSTARLSIQPLLKNYFKDKRIKKIFTKNQSVEFVYNQFRDDLGSIRGGDRAASELQGENDAKRLDEIVIKDLEGFQKKHFTLNYDYFISDPEGTFPGDRGDQYNIDLKRLKLVSVCESGKNPYVFEYNEDQILPRRISFAQDHWGYYNGFTYNKTLVDVNIDARDYDFDDPNEIGYYIKPNDCVRDATESFFDACILTTVNYPTGGRTVFDYQINQHDEYSVIDPYIGGARIKTITNYDLNKVEPVSIKSYTYSNSRIYTDPRGLYKNTYIDGTSKHWSFYNHLYRGSLDIYQSYSCLPMQTLQGIHIGYGEVKEHKEDGSYTVYTYNTGEDEYYDGAFAFPGEDPPTNESGLRYPVISRPYDYTQGQLLYEKYFNSDNKCIKQIRYHNEPFDWVAEPVLHATKISYIPQSNLLVFGNNQCNYSYRYFGYDHYSLTTGVSRLKSKTTTLFNNDDTGISISESYHYNSDDHLNPSEIRISKSDGRSDKKIIKYPIDYKDDLVGFNHAIHTDEYSDGINVMLEKNLVNAPIEQISTISNDTSEEIVDAQLYLYKARRIIDATTQEEKVVVAPEKILKHSSLEKIPYSDVLFSDIDTENDYAFNYYLDYSEEYNYDLYDDENNILQVIGKDGVTTSYIWGYNNTLPIAKVENATYNQVFYTGFEDNATQCGSIRTGINSACSFKKNLTGLTAGTYILSYWKDEGTYSNKDWKHYSQTCQVPGTTYTINVTGRIDDVRFYPKGALMTTYAYDPVFGLTSQTDANNKTTFYKYDNLGRLHLVRDQDNNIVKRYSYNYSKNAAPSIVPLITSYSFDPEGGSVRVDIESNVAWDIQNNPNWLTIEKYDTYIIFSCEANNSLKTNNSTIKLFGGGTSTNIQLSQITLPRLDIKGSDDIPQTESGDFLLGYDGDDPCINIKSTRDVTVTILECSNNCNWFTVESCSRNELCIYHNTFEGSHRRVQLKLEAGDVAKYIWLIQTGN